MSGMSAGICVYSLHEAEQKKQNQTLFTKKV